MCIGHCTKWARRCRSRWVLQLAGSAALIREEELDVRFAQVHRALKDVGKEASQPFLMPLPLPPLHRRQLSNNDFHPVMERSTQDIAKATKELHSHMSPRFCPRLSGDELRSDKQLLAA
jgi:hypothetical protein